MFRSKGTACTSSRFASTSHPACAIAAGSSSFRLFAMNLIIDVIEALARQSGTVPVASESYRVRFGNACWNPLQLPVTESQNAGRIAAQPSPRTDRLKPSAAFPLSPTRSGPG